MNSTAKCSFFSLALEAQHLIFVVHEQHRKMLVLLVGQSHLQEARGLLRVGQGVAARQVLLKDGGGGPYNGFWRHGPESLIQALFALHKDGFALAHTDLQTQKKPA